jgi:transcriptional regulator with XRE-family HTH domain
MYHKTDVHIGRRLRERRMALGMSQAELAEGLGISFQQVQKYESGANRISGSRLWDIASILQTPVSYFFEGLEEAPVEAGEGGASSKPLDRNTLELARAVNSIPDESVKTQLVRLVKAFAKAS